MSRRALALGAATALMALGVVLDACSSSTPGASTSTSATTGPGGSGGNGTGGNVQKQPTQTACTSDTLNVVFSPMYSASDGVHQFQIPAIVEGIKGNAVTWSASDTSMVDLQSDPTSGGVMITVQKAGTVTITAEAGGLCGTSLLTITQASPDDWNAGNERYNNGVVLRFPGRGDGGERPDANDVDAAALRQAACTNCHGPTANGPFKTVAHTPEQAGGFSDDELVTIFTQGQVPDGGYFDPKIVPYEVWQRFHQWTMSPDEAKGIVVYLRSLTPTAQTGSSNFHGRFHDGGGPPPPPPPGDGGPPTVDAGADH